MAQGLTVVAGAAVSEGLCEALANCLVNADYYGRQGVVIVKKPDRIAFSNPGGFRVDLDTAISGGTSDPRNAGLIKMFNLIDVGHRTGSGIPNLFNVWNRQGWPPPEIQESFDPARITITLWMGAVPGRPVQETDRSSGGIDKNASTRKEMASRKTLLQKAAIVDYLTENPQGTSAQIADLLGVGLKRVRKLLAQMTVEGTLEPQGGNRHRTYRLKD